MISENTYSKPFIFAIFLHIIVLAFLIFELTFPSYSTPSAPSGPVIQAVAVSQSVLDKYNQEVQEIQQQKIQQQLAQQRQIQQQIQQQKQVALQKQLQIQKMAQQKAQAIKAAQEKAQEQKAAQQKALKQAQMKKALQQQLKADIQKQFSSNKPHTAAAVAATTAQSTGELDKYKSLIIQSISQQWIVPQNLPKNISCELNVSVAPGGVVLQVSVIKSSGNPVLDNSAVAAVNKASPLPVPTDPNLFNQFRELHLTVKPDGSMVEGRR